jgi:hypothetical protein
MVLDIFRVLVVKRRELKSGRKGKDRGEGEN